MDKLTITKGGRLSARDLDVSKGHIGMCDVGYGGESALSMDLEPDEVRQVIDALLGKPIMKEGEI